jgi:hypothetical protein
MELGGMAALRSPHHQRLEVALRRRPPGLLFELARSGFGFDPRPGPETPSEDFVGSVRERKGRLSNGRRRSIRVSLMFQQCDRG